MQNTLPAAQVTRGAQSVTPLRLEVMTSTHPAFNLSYMELHIPWLLLAGGAFGEQGKQVEVLLFPMATDSRKRPLCGLVSIHPF